MKRNITLAVLNNASDIEKIKSICASLNLEIKEGKHNEMYWHFSVFGDTNDYNKIIEKADFEIITTYLASLGIVADCDDDWLSSFGNCLDLMEKAKNAESRANTAFHNFIMPIKDIEILKEIEKCSAYMNDVQRGALRTRKDVLSGNNTVFMEEMTEVAKSIHCDVKKLREKTGMSRADFAKYFEIPYRTVEDWENKKSNCSSYLFNLMQKDLINNGLI